MHTCTDWSDWSASRPSECACRWVTWLRVSVGAIGHSRERIECSIQEAILSDILHRRIGPVPNIMWWSEVGCKGDVVDLSLPATRSRFPHVVNSCISQTRAVATVHGRKIDHHHSHWDTFDILWLHLWLARNYHRPLCPKMPRHWDTVQILKRSNYVYADGCLAQTRLEEQRVRTRV